MRFTGNGITNCYPDEVDNFVSITVLSEASPQTNKNVGSSVTGAVCSKPVRRKKNDQNLNLTQL